MPETSPRRANGSTTALVDDATGGAGGLIDRVPSRSTLASIREKVGRAFSPARDDGPLGRRTSFGTNMAEERGRAPIVSTGRGGAGNLVRSPSRGVDASPTPGVERGRELYPVASAGAGAGAHPTHAGRGGAGNIRSPSRDARERRADADEEALQAALIAERRGRQTDAPFSSGRGGAGNISTSESRSRSRSAVRGRDGDRDGSRERSRTRDSSRTRSLLHPVASRGQATIASGRGGYGNIIEEKGSHEDLQRIAQEQRYEAEVRKKHDEEEAQHPHTSGRGGAGSVQLELAHVDLSNLSLEERDAYLKVHAHDAAHPRASGRGGAGNFTPPARDAAHTPDGERERGRGGATGGHGGVLGSVLRSLSRAAGREPSREPSADRRARD
ncbi:hypothetical protein Q5752_006210 [Cryptotrichosporon argae]